MAFRYTNYLLGLLFGLSAIAQINDPDPILWVLMYAAGSVVSLLYAFNKLEWRLAGIVAITASVWALTITPDLTLSGFRHIFEEIGMRYVGVEAAREFGGLLIIAIWSGILSMKAKASGEIQ